MFYGWEPMRDISRPGSLRWSEYIYSYSDPHTDDLLTDGALRCIEAHRPDFVFLYLPQTDDKGGHDTGWMSPTYLQCVHDAIDDVRRVCEAVGDEYTVVITADHGGHDRMHGADIPEDMTIPMFFLGKDFAPGRVLEHASILDVAPTIAKLMGVPRPREWEGREHV